MRSTVDDPARRLADFLRRQHPRKMPEHVEALTGVSASVIRQLTARGSVPNFANFSRLIEAYGPELLLEMFGPAPWILDAIEWEKARVAASGERNASGP